MLIVLTLMLAGPYVALSAIEAVSGRPIFSRAVKGRLGVTLFLLTTASGHFVQAHAMQHMLPPFVPERLVIIHATGVIEILGAIGVWLPGLQRLAGSLIILMLLCFLPANIYAALNEIEFGGSINGPLYLLIRVPYQFLVIWWVYWATEQSWFPAGATWQPSAYDEKG